MTTKSYAEPEELSAAAGVQQGERMRGSCVRTSDERALEQARVAKTAEAIEEKLSAMIASMESEPRRDSSSVPIGVDERLHHIKNYLKTNASVETKARTAAAHHAVGAASTASSRPAPGVQGRAWFEARFGELKEAVERLASVNSFGAADEMTALNSRLGDLMGRLDCALEFESHETALKSLECQLAGIAGYLERTKAWAEDRHARVDARFDGVEARLDNLGQAVEQSQRAFQNVSEQTAAQISEAMRRMPPPPGLIRIERDVRTLSTTAREQEERTAEAVSELHGALRLILDQLASMGEKLSGVGDMLEDTRERLGVAQDEVKVSLGRANVQPMVKGDRAPGPAGGGPRQVRAASQPSAKGHGQSIAYGQLSKRAGNQAPAEHRGSKVALAGALIILALTGVAMFVHQLRDSKGDDLAGGAQPQLGRAAGSKEALSALPKPIEGQAGGAAQAAGAFQGKGERAGGPVSSIAPAGSEVAKNSEAVKGDAGNLVVRHAPGVAGPLPSQGASVSKPIDDVAVQGAREWRAVETFALPASLGSERVRLAAIAGEPWAQYTVANFYETGQGVARDPSAAARWFRRGAEQNHAPSQYRLATLYERGHGVDRDLAVAESLYRSAARLGNVKAMHNLAVLLIHKQGEAPDYATAANWFGQAAERGFVDSQYNLAILYDQGLGVSRNAETAYRWFALSARGGDRQAENQRDRVAGGLTVGSATKVDAELQVWRAAEIDQPANRVQAPQEQAASGQLPAGDGGAPKGLEPRAVEPKPTPKKPAGIRQKKPQVLSKAEENGESKSRAKAQIAASFVDPRNFLTQTNLSRLGYELGPRDGQIGPRTRKAIRQFQSDHGLAATGEVSDSLLNDLALAQQKG